jgi:DivIVA domain-containing protein
MDHIIGWVGIFVVVPTYLLGPLSMLVAARLRRERVTAAPATMWVWLLLSPLYIDTSSALLGHPGPGWLHWPLLVLSFMALAFAVVPGLVSRRKAGLPWWWFWTTTKSSAVGSADPGNPEGSQEDDPGPVIVPDGAALIDRIRTVRFSTTILQPGYDEREVDKFLDKLAADLGEFGRLDPAEVRDVTFSTTRLRPGYCEQEVDDFLDEVTAQAAG